MAPGLKALRVTGLVALVFLFCLLPSAASAASLRPAVHIAQSSAPIAAATASATSGGSTSTTTTSTGSPDEIYLGAGALGFGFVALLSVLMFVRSDRRQTLQIQQQLVASGVTIQPEQVPDGPPGPPTVTAPIAPTNPITIEGPDNVTVGQTVDFTARQQGVQAVEAWSAQPTDILQLPAEATSRASVTVLKAGQVTLFAGAGPDRGSKPLVASPVPRAAPQALLFIGAGWGTVVVAIAIMSITAALGLAGALTGEAVATILGGLVGYVVAKSQSEPDSSKPSNQGSSNQSGDAQGGAA